MGAPKRPHRPAYAPNAISTNPSETGNAEKSGCFPLAQRQS
jgi:hypothetical protein